MSETGYLKRWAFTYWSKQACHDEIKQALELYCGKYAFSWEDSQYQEKDLKEAPYVGDHYQGEVDLVKRLCGNQLIKLSKGSALEGCHWSPSSNNSKAFKYPTKRISHVAGPWCDQGGEEIPGDLIGKVLWPWQVQIKTVCEAKTYDRCVNVLIDTAGGQGKSTLARIADYEGWAGWIPPYEDFKDILQCVYGTGRKNAYIIDLPRRYGGTKIWQAIEQIKNGTIIDARHRFKKLRIPIPVIWIMTNEVPAHIELMSVDRWRCWNVVDGVLRAAPPPPPEVKQSTSRKRKH